VSVFDDMGDWGYCKRCHRLVLVDDEGFLNAHTTALSSADCPGSKYKPWLNVPKELTAEQERRLTGIDPQETTRGHDTRGTGGSSGE
jgi:hypothetical protein